MNYLILILIFIVFFLLNVLSKPKKIETYKNYTPDELFNCLKYMSNILSKNKIKHWICHGTLLGAVRSNDIIPFDYDFDLGAYLKDINKIIALNEIIKKMDINYQDLVIIMDIFGMVKEKEYGEYP